jgi:hypothetical protein
MEPTSEEEARQSSQHMKDGIRDSMQRTNLKDEECFDPEFWKENVYLSSS